MESSSPISALRLAGAQSGAAGELGVAERAFTAAIIACKDANNPSMGAALYCARADVRIRLGLFWGGMDDCTAALALAPEERQAQALRDRALAALADDAATLSPAKEINNASHWVRGLAPSPERRLSQRPPVLKQCSGGLANKAREQESLPFTSLPTFGGTVADSPADVTPTEKVLAGTALYNAAASGRLDVETLRRLLRNGAQISAPDGGGRTALKIALAAGQHRVVRMLLDYCYRELRLRQRMAWAVAALSNSANSLVSVLPISISISVGRHLEFGRSSRRGLDGLVLRHLLDKRFLELARDFGEATGAVVGDAPDIAAERVAREIGVVEDLMAATLSPPAPLTSSQQTKNNLHV